MIVTVRRILAWMGDWPGARVWMIALAACVSGPACFAFAYYLLNQPPTILISSSDALSQTSGHDMEFVVKKQDNDVCLTFSARWLWRPDPTDPTRPQWRAIDSTPFGPPALAGLVDGNPHIGEPTAYRLSIPLPVDIEPDTWTPWNIAVDLCNGRFRTPRLTQGKPIKVGLPQ